MLDGFTSKTPQQANNTATMTVNTRHTDRQGVGQFRYYESTENESYEQELNQIRALSQLKTNTDDIIWTKFK